MKSFDLIGSLIQHFRMSNHRLNVRLFQWNRQRDGRLSFRLFDILIIFIVLFFLLIQFSLNRRRKSSKSSLCYFGSALLISVGDSNSLCTSSSSSNERKRLNWRWRKIRSRSRQNATQRPAAKQCPRDIRPIIVVPLATPLTVGLVGSDLI